jgi:hypothetical protein
MKVQPEALIAELTALPKRGQMQVGAPEPPRITEAEAHARARFRLLAVAMERRLERKGETGVWLRSTKNRVVRANGRFFPEVGMTRLKGNGLSVPVW